MIIVEGGQSRDRFRYAIYRVILAQAAHWIQEPDYSTAQTYEKELLGYLDQQEMERFGSGQLDEDAVVCHFKFKRSGKSSEFMFDLSEI